MTLFFSTSNPSIKNQLGFPEVSLPLRTPSTTTPGVRTSTSSSPQATLQPIPHHTTLPPPPGSDSTPTSTRGRRCPPPPPPRLRARDPEGARAHTFSRFPNLLPGTGTSWLRWNSARPAGARHSNEGGPKAFTVGFSTRLRAGTTSSFLSVPGVERAGPARKTPGLKACELRTGTRRARRRRKASGGRGVSPGLPPAQRGGIPPGRGP
ncbi:translation initiation factor IF-2-like isoform X1 [Panthera tigris]|uniref:translation initiation factor IF-2-like isoform X1 n=1 Tax=Panthera tigris TaxID=9694 RepID=UPI001C6FAC67|nr:translation initiation factor IF-2-like isoform X1 [Panthera tigris]XP_042831963.1 translation initiation factor IF-2-like isoform X1 [Panthera tigris]XP_042831964.1 translation initiation factor IF-2-like isoform X1 [Panthera tigris]XP_042831965.1 translation initiation factor IF-2-like isoform X1 [Panthera tigris]